MRTSRGISVGIATVARLGQITLVTTIATASLAACAPAIDGPVERQRATDREDGDRLAAQLAQLPGAVRAEVTLRRATRDPLGVTAPTAATAAVLVIVDDRADRAAITRSATTLAHATAPEIPAPAILVEVGAHRPTLARVGPFSVEAGSRGPLRALLATTLALIAALAGWIAVRELRQRRGNSAQ